MSDFDDTISLADENYSGKEKIILKEISNKSIVSSISLRNCHLKPDQISDLLSQIVDPSYLCELDFSFNNLGSSIASILPSNISPSTLILDNIKLGDSGLISLSKCINMVRILSVSSNEITSRGIIVFFSSVENCLTSLNLSNNKIDDSAVFSIQSTIKKLDVSGNSFSPLGIAALCEKLSKSKVKSLSLSDMKLNKCSKSLSLLISSTSLKSLYLRNCSITKFPDIPNDSKLKVLDLTGNKSIVEFKTPSSLAIIGNIMMKKKINLDFSDFEKVRLVVDELKRSNEIIVDDSGEIKKLLEMIKVKTQELNTMLLILKRKTKPSVRSLSKYASKINSPSDILSLNITGKNIDGFPVSSSLSTSLKYNLYQQFLILLCQMNEKSRYFVSDFNINSFLVTKDNKLHLRDKSIIIKEKLSNFPIEHTITNFTEQLFGFTPNESLFHSNFSHSLISSVINKIRPTPNYTIERTEESLISLFSKLNNSEILTHFQLSIEGESAVDHGGVLRDVFAQFWEEASLSKFEMSDKSVSLLPINNGINFEEIGKIMIKSLLESIPISVPIHSIVFRFITNQLPQNKKEWIQSLSEYDPQIADNIDYDQPSDEEIIERCKEILIDRRLKELNELKKGFFFSRHIEIIISNTIDWWTLMNDIIGEEELTPNKLLKEIKFINLSEKSFKVWVKFIKQFNKEQIKQFLRLITGLNGMPAGGYKKRGKQLIITKSDRFFAHTCSFELETPEYTREKDINDAISTVFVAMESDYSMNEWYNL
ncbi:hypothetical protein TRFO_06491 [Tritrichomonas foetus]|uniref:HECT domain-containing protein n=1 Tax=Tritrichomonas foetus TaxID=1144522 RepID=A0A1J4JYC3_9EUKA|nr:hypothetical protein TRFO_06491 [Tritrichomonas foetus]|eukprot:OHT04161.1 hypothetical protein TRFO_06491 [Tritrichomonas foetus]